MLNLELNRFVSASEGSPTVIFADRVRELKESGRKIISLHTGDPDFKAPELIKESICRAIEEDYSHYSESRGLPNLRLEITNYVKQTKQVKYNPSSEIIVTNGGIHAYYCAISALFNIGDELIILTPAWPSHIQLPKLNGVVIVEVSTSVDKGFLPDIQEIESARTNKTKGILINFPNNPTGAIATSEFLNELIAWAEKNKIWIISDEVYEEISDKYSPCPASINRGKELVISINSFSKSLAITGYRIGYILAPKHIINNILKLSQYTITNVSTFIQKGIADVLNKKELRTAIISMNNEYNRRKELIDHMLLSSGLPIKYIRPNGAFYYFLEIKNTGLSSQQFSMDLLQKYAIGVVAGNVFGAGGEGFIRLTFAASESDITTGVNGILSLIQENLSN